MWFLNTHLSSYENNNHVKSIDIIISLSTDVKKWSHDCICSKTCIFHKWNKDSIDKSKPQLMIELRVSIIAGLKLGTYYSSW